MKSNLVMGKSQVAEQEISVGVDMGGSLMKVSKGKRTKF